VGNQEVLDRLTNTLTAWGCEVVARWRTDPTGHVPLPPAVQDFLSAAQRSAGRAARLRRMLAVALVALTLAASITAVVAARTPPKPTVNARSPMNSTRPPCRASWPPRAKPSCRRIRKPPCARQRGMANRTDLRSRHRAVTARRSERWAARTYSSRASARVCLPLMNCSTRCR
jgi:hypothetical protein